MSYSRSCQSVLGTDDVRSASPHAGCPALPGFGIESAVETEAITEVACHCGSSADKLTSFGKVVLLPQGARRPTGCSRHDK